MLTVGGVAGDKAAASSFETVNVVLITNTRPPSQWEPLVIIRLPIHLQLLPAIIVVSDSGHMAEPPDNSR